MRTLETMKQLLMLNRAMVYRANAEKKLELELMNALRLAVLSHIISQLRPGAELNRVTLPTFILEPRSMLERITKYRYLYAIVNST